MLAPASREYDTQRSRWFRLRAGAGRPSVAISTQPCGAIERTRRHSPDVLTRFDALNADDRTVIGSRLSSEASVAT
jgi:hypothetical protein